MAGNELISRGLASCTGTAAAVAAGALSNETTSEAPEVVAEEHHLTDSAFGLGQSRPIALILTSLLSLLAVYVL